MFRSSFSVPSGAVSWKTTDVVDFMSALLRNGCVGASIVSLKRADALVKPSIQLFQARQIAQAIRQALVACDERVKAGDGCCVNGLPCVVHGTKSRFFNLF
jgi:hypothetical protein